MSYELNKYSLEEMQLLQHQQQQHAEAYGMEAASLGFGGGGGGGLGMGGMSGMSGMGGMGGAFGGGMGGDMGGGVGSSVGGGGDADSNRERRYSTGDVDVPVQLRHPGRAGRDSNMMSMAYGNHSTQALGQDAQNHHGLGGQQVVRRVSVDSDWSNHSTESSHSNVLLGAHGIRRQNSSGPGSTGGLDMHSANVLQMEENAFRSASCYPGGERGGPGSLKMGDDYAHMFQGYCSQIERDLLVEDMMKGGSSGGGGMMQDMQFEQQNPEYTTPNRRHSHSVDSTPAPNSAPLMNAQHQPVPNRRRSHSADVVRRKSDSKVVGKKPSLMKRTPSSGSLKRSNSSDSLKRSNSSNSLKKVGGKSKKRNSLKKNSASAAAAAAAAAAAVTGGQQPLQKPKRALSAYNYFFSHERARLLGQEAQELSTERDTTRRVHRKTHGKIGFTDLAKHISQEWKNIDPERRSFFEAKAAEDMKRYRKAMDEYNAKLHSMSGSFEAAVVTSSDATAMTGLTSTATVGAGGSSPGTMGKDGSAGCSGRTTPLSDSGMNCGGREGADSEMGRDLPDLPDPMDSVTLTPPSPSHQGRPGSSGSGTGRSNGGSPRKKSPTSASSPSRRGQAGASGNGSSKNIFGEQEMFEPVQKVDDDLKHSLGAEIIDFLSNLEDVTDDADDNLGNNFIPSHETVVSNHEISMVGSRSPERSSGDENEEPGSGRGRGAFENIFEA